MNKGKCSLCHDTGWVFEAKEKLDGVVTLEILPCLIPDCVKSGQDIWLISVNMLKLDEVSIHPKHNYVMSLSRGD